MRLPKKMTPVKIYYLRLDKVDHLQVYLTTYHLLKVSKVKYNKNNPKKRSKLNRNNFHSKNKRKKRKKALMKIRLKKNHFFPKSHNLNRHKYFHNQRVIFLLFVHHKISLVEVTQINQR